MGSGAEGAAFGVGGRESISSLKVSPTHEEDRGLDQALPVRSSEERSARRGSPRTDHDRARRRPDRGSGVAELPGVTCKSEFESKLKLEIVAHDDLVERFVATHPHRQDRRSRDLGSGGYASSQGSASATGSVNWKVAP